MTLKQCLSKFKKQFRNMPNLGYYINNIVIPYAESGNADYYREFTKILLEDVFTLRCLVGFVYCLIEYCEDTYGATFENKLSGETVFFQNIMDYDAVEVNSKLFTIFD